MAAGRAAALLGCALLAALYAPCQASAGGRELAREARRLLQEAPPPPPPPPPPPGGDVVGPQGTDWTFPSDVPVVDRPLDAFTWTKDALTDTEDPDAVMNLYFRTNPTVIDLATTTIEPAIWRFEALQGERGGAPPTETAPDGSQTYDNQAWLDFGKLTNIGSSYKEIRFKRWIQSMETGILGDISSSQSYLFQVAFAPTADALFTCLQTPTECEAAGGYLATGSGTEVVTPGLFVEGQTLYEETPGAGGIAGGVSSEPDGVLIWESSDAFTDTDLYWGGYVVSNAAAVFQSYVELDFVPK